VPEALVNGIRLYYEEHGEGAAIACIHGGGSSALMWVDAVVWRSPLHVAPRPVPKPLLSSRVSRESSKRMSVA
jgi:pimeloyl-ACP methyl ester carboxylesterase